MCKSELVLWGLLSEQVCLTSVLLGTDVPVWRELLGGVLAEDDESPQALVVTRSQRAAMKEAASGVILSSVEDEGESSSEPAELGMKWMKQVTTA